MSYQQQQSGGFRKGLDDYVDVHVRLQKFWEKFPNGRIYTEIFKWTDDGIIGVRAEVYRDIADEKPAGTGHAYEREGSNQVNKTSALENCETSAVGRALANAGFEIKKSIASRQEVENAIHQQEQLNKQEQPKVKRADKSQYASIKTAVKAVGMNEDTFYALLADLGIEDYAAMTYDQANILIEKLADYKPQEVAN
jgi:hypothetical protein